MTEAQEGVYNVNSGIAVRRFYLDVHRRTEKKTHTLFDGEIQDG